MSSRGLGVALAAVALVMCVATTGRPGPSDDPELTRILALPTSAATIAALVPYARQPEVQQRLSLALRDASPAVRAMAGRVVFVTHSQGLVPVVEGLLPNETDGLAAAEALRPRSVEGRVDIRAQVTNTGCAQNAETVISLHPLLDFAALHAIYATKYLPSTVDRKPVTTTIDWRIWFRP